MTKKVIENFRGEIEFFRKKGHYKIFGWTTPRPALALYAHAVCCHILGNRWICCQ